MGVKPSKFNFQISVMKPSVSEKIRMEENCGVRLAILQFRGIEGHIFGCHKFL